MNPILGNMGTQTIVVRTVTFLSIKYIEDRCTRDFSYGHLSTTDITRPQTEWLRETSHALVLWNKNWG